MKASSGHCTNDEWEDILIAALIDLDATRLRDIEIKADVPEGSEEESGPCILNFKKNIQGITVSLNGNGSGSGSGSGGSLLGDFSLLMFTTATTRVHQTGRV